MYLRGCMVHRMQPLMEKASRYYIIFDFTLISYLCPLNVLSLFRLVFQNINSEKLKTKHFFVCLVATQCQLCSVTPNRKEQADLQQPPITPM